MKWLNVIHLQLPDRSLACGATHLDAYQSLHFTCCRRDPRRVGCQACKNTAAKAAAA